MARPKGRTCSVCGRRAHAKGLRHLPSRKFQARLLDPYGVPRSKTFQTARDAETWLAQQHADISRGQWRPKDATTAVQFRDYTETWLADRKVKGRPLAPRTRSGYRDLLDRFILPEFGTQPVHTIEREQVERWYDRTAPDHPTYRARAYSLLRSILASAVDDEHLDRNPARIRGAGKAERRHEVRPASKSELAQIVENVPERYRLMIHLAAWCALRFGELTELRRSDVDTREGVLRVRRGVVVVRTEDLPTTLPPRTRLCGCRPGCVVGPTKSEAGARDVHVPAALMPLVREHLLKHTAPGPDGLLFPAKGNPAGHLRQSAMARVFYPAREAAGRPDLRFHDLRHTGAVFAAQTGATLAELMARLGHSSSSASLRYQHAAEGRDALIASRLSEMMQ